jgi:hypothetical protein
MPRVVLRSCLPRGRDLFPSEKCEYELVCYRKEHKEDIIAEMRNTGADNGWASSGERSSWLGRVHG